jgi:hypothetical protein
VASSTSGKPVSPSRLADLIEEHGRDVLNMVVAALRAEPPRAEAAPVSVAWREVDTIEGFEHPWPGVHEHYPPMPVWQGQDDRGVARFAIGKPAERMNLYGRERGWISVWEVVNRRPREQRAVFVEADDFASTGDHVAVISGRGGSKKGGFAPHEDHALPSIYSGMRVEVHRHRCNGPYARNRLAVVAREDEPEVMLNHALAHLRLRA